MAEGGRCKQVEQAQSSSPVVHACTHQHSTQSLTKAHHPCVGGAGCGDGADGEEGIERETEECEVSDVVRVSEGHGPSLLPTAAHSRLRQVRVRWVELHRHLHVQYPQDTMRALRHAEQPLEEAGCHRYLIASLV
jgi:hypothetical protein